MTKHMVILTNMYGQQNIKHILGTDMACTFDNLLNF